MLNTNNVVMSSLTPESTSVAPALPTLTTTGESSMPKIPKHKAMRVRRSSSPRRILSAPLVEVETLTAQTKALADEEVRRLADDIFADCPEATDESDRIARAVLKIVDALYEPDAGVRSALAVKISRAVYARTRDCAERMDEFAATAGVTFGEGLLCEMAA